MKNQNILIVGAGLCGSALAIRMAQRGHRVQLIEKRPDLRTHSLAAGRSINLAFSDRGNTVMKLNGIEDKVKEICIPMRGRMIHEANGHTFLSRYSGLEDEYINSISRTGLNALLLNEAEKLDAVEIHFNMECISVDLEKAQGEFKDSRTGKIHQKSGDILIGTDGAGSIIRKNMFLKHGFLFDYSQKFLSHGYKELFIPAGENGSFQMEKNALHIWPRGENMIIALPNPDGSYTVTLFMAFKDAKENLEQLKSVEAVENYFKKTYPDAYQLMPNLTKTFFENPTSSLGMVKCSPWNYKGKTLIMGDAAHAMVPFYGQGMNASMEDITVLDSVLNENLDSWEAIFDAFVKKRKKDADAIVDLSLDNFEEMKADTASPLFQAKRELETKFEMEYPKAYAAKYRLVAFQEDIGYDEAMRRGRAQDKAMLQLIADRQLPDDMPTLKQIEIVKKRTEEILKKAE